MNKHIILTKIGAVEVGTIFMEFKNGTMAKYARILLFQFVFNKYVFGFRNYDGLIFVVFDVIFQNVIMRKYDKIRF